VEFGAGIPLQSSALSWYFQLMCRLGKAYGRVLRRRISFIIHQPMPSWTGADKILSSQLGWLPVIANNCLQLDWNCELNETLQASSISVRKLSWFESDCFFFWKI